MSCDLETIIVRLEGPCLVQYVLCVRLKTADSKTIDVINERLECIELRCRLM